MKRRLVAEGSFVFALTAAAIANSLFLKSPLIGIPVTLLFLGVGGIVAGRALFGDEARISRIMLGLLTFLVAMSLLGTLLILTARFTEILSTAGTAGIGVLLWFVSVRKRSNDPAPSNDQVVTTDKRSRLSSYLILAPYGVFTALAFYLLLSGRTGEGQYSVWLTIPSDFLLVFLLSSLFLFLTILLTRLNRALKFILVVLHYFLARSLFLLIWYPGRYGDPWTHLGNERFIDSTGAPYAFDWLVKNLYVVDIIGSKAQYALVASLKGLLVVDIYWVHVTFIPLIWGLFVPICAYELARLLGAKKTGLLAVLAAASAVLSPILIIWGSVSVPNSLGFLFLLFSLVLGLHWFKGEGKKYWLLALAVSVAALFAHPLTGIFSFIFLAGITIIVPKKLPAPVKVTSYILVFLTYPISLLVMQARFSPVGLTNMENYLSLQQAVFSPLFVFAFIGLLSGLRNRHLERKSSTLLFLFYFTTMAGYFITAFGMANVPYGPDRLLPIANLILVPLVAAGLLETAGILNKALTHARALAQHEVKSGASPIRWPGLLLVGIFLASQATLAVYQAYPQREMIPVQPAGYEIDAIYYINSVGTSYVVLCDTNFASLAIGFLGAPYGYGGGSQGMFGIPQWEWWTQKLYMQMINSPSVSLMDQALSGAQASASFFVVSVREPNFEEIVARTSEILPVNRVFGNGNLYVFAYPTPVQHGTGPNVKVAFDNGAFTEISTTSAYISRSEVSYNLTVTGHSSYNVTEYPPNWTFQGLLLNGSAMSLSPESDVNSFVYVSGLQSPNVLTVMWQANDLYPAVGWKDDSFRSGWETNPYYAGTINPEISNSSNVLRMSWNFVPNVYQYYYYIKRVSVSTDEFSYMIVRWRSEGAVTALGIAYSSDERSIYAIVPYDSQSTGWTTSVVQLKPNSTSAYVLIGITNVGDQRITGLLSLYVDYVMICAKSSSP